jgi:hypothetical protein
MVDDWGRETRRVVESFADWQRALRPGDLVTIAVHAGEGLVQHAARRTTTT